LHGRLISKIGPALPKARDLLHISSFWETRTSGNLFFGPDHGIAAQSILLGATEAGLGGCIIATIRKERLRQELSIPDHYEILLVLALGKPKEIVEIEVIGPDGDIKYWRDDQGIHHVPKRSLDEIIVTGDENKEKPAWNIQN